MDDAPTLATSVEPSEKRQRAPAVLPAPVQAALAVHQAAFDSHSLALSSTAEWSDAARRVMRIAAFCSQHPPRLRELVDATAVDLSEVRAIETSVAVAASTAPGRVQAADLSFQRRQRDILVDSALRRIRTAQQNRAAATAALRTELGGPWTDEEAQHWVQVRACWPPSRPARRARRAMR